MMQLETRPSHTTEQYKNSKAILTYEYSYKPSPGKQIQEEHPHNTIRQVHNSTMKDKHNRSKKKKTKKSNKQTKKTDTAEPRLYIPYGWKFWRGIYFGGLAGLRAICQYFIRQNLIVCCHQYS